MENSSEYQQYINQQLGTQLPIHDYEIWFNTLVDHINQLLLTDVPRLIQVLYRLDVEEKKIKDLHKQQPGTDAAVLIARLMIQRQQEKIIARKKFNTGRDIPEDEKW